jgi:hypothetical protein
MWAACVIPKNNYQACELMMASAFSLFHVCGLIEQFWKMKNGVGDFYFS